MFFAQDVLFKDGPLAILWLAGNERFKSKSRLHIVKNRRNKPYSLMLQANLVELTKLIRKYFPQMGSAHGLSLKKTMLLVRGLGVIYISQLQLLVWNMSDTQLRMQRTNLRLIGEIDLPTTITRHREPRDLAAEQYNPMTVGFGDLSEPWGDMVVVGEDFGPRCFNANAELLPYDQQHHQPPILSPSRNDDEQQQGDGTRRRKKRKRSEPGFEENQVLQLLQDAISRNQASHHCIIEPDPIPNPSAFEGGFDQFGDMGMGFEDFMQTGSGPNDKAGPDIISVENPQLGSPTRVGTTRDLLGDGQGRRAGASRNRLASEIDTDAGEPQGDHEVDENVQQSPPAPPGLNLESLCITQRRGRRRHRGLEIDEEPQIPLQNIHQQLQSQKRPLDYDELQDVLANDHDEVEKKRQRSEAVDMLLNKVNFRKPLTKRPTHVKQPHATILNFIAEAHDIARQQRQTPEQENDAGRREQGERSDEISDIRAGQDLQPGPGSTFGPPESIVRSDIDVPANDALPDVEQEPENRSGFEYQAPEMDIAEMFDNNPPVVEEEIIQGEDIVLGNEQLTFKQLFPPERTSKMQAATGFFHLLKMQSLEKVILEQREPYGDIFVTKI